MRYRRNWNRIITLLLCMVLSTLMSTCAYGGGNGELRFHILMINDPHSYILPYREAVGDKVAEVGGMSHAMQLIMDEEEKIKKEDQDPVYLVEAGDIMLGVKGSTFSGEPEYSILTRMSFDIGVLGNHDFDGGVSPLAKLGPTLKFPVLASNITFDDKGTGACYAKTAIIKKGGVTIGFFGLVTPMLKSVISDPTGFAIEQDFISLAKKYVAELQAKGVDVIVAVNHIGLDYDIKLAKEVAGINVIVGGHSHDAIRNKTVAAAPDVSSVIIGQAGLDGRYAGRFDIVMSGGRLDPVKSGWKLLEVVPKTPEVKWISDLGRTVMDKLSKNLKLGNPVAVFTKSVNVRKGAVRGCENAIGDIYTDALRDFGFSRIGVANGGTFRIGRIVPAGDFSPSDMLDLLPFANTVERTIVTGAEIRKQLEISASSLKGDGDLYDPSLRTYSGEFLQISGLKVVYDLKRTPALVVNRKLVRPGERVVEALVDGVSGWEPLDDGAVYSVCGSKYALSAWNKLKTTDIEITDMVMLDSYFESKYDRRLTPETSSRITIIK